MNWAGTKDRLGRRPCGGGRHSAVAHSQKRDDVGGWYDIFKRGTLNNFIGLSRRKSYTKLLMGPWTHSTGQTFAGDIDFGEEAEMKMKHEAVRWFDHFLKGKDQGIEEEPPVT